MADLLPPRLEGTIGLGPVRRLGFAEFGPPDGRPLIWLHGTPGARRQIPQEARALAVDLGLRIIGIDRPGIGHSTPHRYPSVAAFTDDLRVVAECLGVARTTVIGMSGGGPYALAAAALLPDVVVGVGVLGGVAPTVGPDAIDGGAVSFGAHFVPLIRHAQRPMSFGLTTAVRMIKPLASPGLDLYARLSPEGDRRILGRPEFKAMFIDDLLNGSRTQLSAPLADLLLFSSDWGFRLADVEVPVRWWHGDADHIVPYAHAEHVVSRLADAVLSTMPGESHLGSLGEAAEVLGALGELWDASEG